MNSIHIDNEYQFFSTKIHCLFETIKITALDVQCSQMSTKLFIRILNLLPNLDLITIFELAYVFERTLNKDEIDSFKKNKITKIILKDMSNFKHIIMIIELFPDL